jgi:hypothetical protein
MRELYPHKHTREVAEALGRSVSAIYGRAELMKLHKTAEYFDSPDAHRFDGRKGTGTRFAKGHVPANKGLRRPGWHRGRMRETQFRKGDAPHNTLPVGSYRLDKDGVLQRKIGTAKGSNSKRWRGVHELVWCAAHGPVPPKHIVVFKPGMRTAVLDEITLDRVECISLAENMRRNTLHRYPKQIVGVIQLRGALMRQIHRREREKQN